uniref:Uncharacterized protein n=1 Tax=Ciona intestinalis TaxID=7719 RepID=H2XR00_CIOIN
MPLLYLEYLTVFLGTFYVYSFKSLKNMFFSPQVYINLDTSTNVNNLYPLLTSN